MQSASAIFELLLVFGGVLAVGFWELYSLRRDKRRSREKEQQAPPGPANRDEPGR